MSCNTAGAATLNIVQSRVADYNETYTYLGYDITGWSFSLSVAPDFGSAATFTVTTTINANTSVITITDAATGEIEVFIHEDDIALVPAAADPADDVTYVYNIVATDSDGVEGLFTTGTFTVIAGVA